MTYELEIRVPISPTPDFFRRIHFMAASLRRLRPDPGSYLLVACVGGDVEAEDLYEAQPWSKDYPIVWRWADREMFRRDSFWETSREIFRQPTRGRVVMCADADVLFVNDFFDLIGDLERDPAVAGVIAHAPPLRGPEMAELWPRLCQGYGVRLPPSIHEYTGWRFMTVDRMTPVYFNFGMVVAPASLMQILQAEMEPADDFVNTNLETFFRFQLALTLAIQKADLPTRSLPLRFNFPNDRSFDTKYPEELREVRILHYLRCETIDRERDFRTLDDVRALIGRTDLVGSDEILRQRLAELFPLVAREEMRLGGDDSPLRASGWATVPASSPRRHRKFRQANEQAGRTGKLPKRLRELYQAVETNELPAQAGAERRLTAIAVPELLQRNDPSVLALGVENTGEIILRALAERLGRADLAGLDLLDIGCGVRFAQTLVNRDVPFASYTGIDVWPTLVTWLQENVEKQDDRFHFSCWNVYNAMYNKAASPMESYQDLPVSGSYDVIMGYSLFTHLDPGDASAILRLARKVVRVDGSFLLTAFCGEAIADFEDRVPDKPLLNAFYNPAYLQKLIEEAGWKVLSSQPPYDYMQHSWLCQPVTPA